MDTSYIYLLYADGRFYARVTTEELSVKAFQTMVKYFPEGTHFELKILKNMEDEKIDK